MKWKVFNNLLRRILCRRFAEGVFVNSQLTMNYITDRSLAQERQGDDVEEQKKSVRNKWKLSEDGSSTCGNILVAFIDGKAVLTEGYSRDSIYSWQQISSALALYRTISLFECGLDAKHSDFYKSNWYVELEHKETGTILGLGEWKGAFQIFTPYTSFDKINAAYQRDAEELLTLLVSPTLTIGYDGTVAGTVA